MGPVVSLEHQAEILGFVERALDQGAVAATKRAALADGRLAHGCFVPPTVLEVEPDAEIWREEVFGPVIAIVAVDSLGEAIDLVNDSAYGLSAAVFTDNISEASAFIDGVEVGQVAVNLPTSGWDVHMPFGGYKTSSFGSKEQGLEGLNFYTRVKTVAVGT
jgi:aldehyde dehydrogenase (NAD+)